MGASNLRQCVQCAECLSWINLVEFESETALLAERLSWRNQQELCHSGVLFAFRTVGLGSIHLTVAGQRGIRDQSMANVWWSWGFSLSLVFAAFAASATDCSFEASYPRHYVAGRVKDGSIKLDGVLDEPEWSQADWTTKFVDISTQVSPRFTTVAKMVWDSHFLYIAARVQEPQIWANISHTCHCNDTTEDQVIFHDNDFEVFVDPSGSTHGYKEFEMNAVNATWDLLLNKPYANKGFENSTRVFGKRGFDLLRYGLRSGSKVFGALNNPALSSDQDYWQVEIGLPLHGLVVAQPGRPKLPGEDIVFWRINFSRVEWHVAVHENRYVKLALPEDNWVWSPLGIVDMHRPERWGILQFSNSPNAPKIRHPHWTLHQVAFTVYGAQEAFHAQRGRYASNVDELVPFVQGWPTSDASVILGACSATPEIVSRNDNRGYTARIQSRDGRYTATINEERLFLVDAGQHALIDEM